MHQAPVKLLLAVRPLRSFCGRQEKTALFVFGSQMLLDLTFHKVHDFLTSALMLNVLGVSLSVLSHFLPLQWRSFSHLVLFSAKIGDAWATIALCSGRVTMGAEPWPVRAFVRVSPAVKYT